MRPPPLPPALAALDVAAGGEASAGVDIDELFRVGSRLSLPGTWHSIGVRSSQCARTSAAVMLPAFATQQSPQVTVACASCFQKQQLLVCGLPPHPAPVIAMCNLCMPDCTAICDPTTQPPR